MYKKNKIDIQKCNRYIIIYEYFTYGGYEERIQIYSAVD